MCTRNSFVGHRWILLLTVLCLVAVGYAEPLEQERLTPDLGVEISNEMFALWDITVKPDGSGLPAGKGTAIVGAHVYLGHCRACHGEKGAGGINDQLVGRDATFGIRTVGNYWPYATTLFDYIRRAMPYHQPQSLGVDDTYAVTAYLLYLNGIIDKDAEMNAITLPQVAMPNRDNFLSVYPE